MTVDTAKAAARSLRTDLAEQGITISHGAALEMVAHQLGHRDWNTASALLEPDQDVGVKEPVPVLRVQRFDDVREFYVDFLGFSIEWEHRYASGMPLYVRLVRGNAQLDLSEHHGDGTPGSVVWIPVRSAAALHAELQRTQYPSMRPGIDPSAPGGPTIEVIDPSGNTLRFCEA